MNTITQTLEAVELIESLEKDSISKETAKKIVNFAEKQRSEAITKQDVEFVVEPIKRDIFWLKWVVGIGFSLGFGLLLSVMIYLHSDLKSDVNKRIDKLEGNMKQMQTDMKQMQADTKQMQVDMKQINEAAFVEETLKCPIFACDAVCEHRRRGYRRCTERCPE